MVIAQPILSKKATRLKGRIYPRAREVSVHMESKWVEIRRCTWLHQAQLLQSVLESAGIQSLISNEHTVGIQPLLGVGLGGVQLLVKQDDVERAEKLLEPHDRK